ncbi:hypothetical protein [Stenotrophomonas sp. 24(2023)]|uniref:hypothetical protein n=1 Tax=Stenotrophomonas sp. 24(2023) TaxID=3068324 RepID=UPI0027E02DE6|nr:hypothetical protein [Stenotrophomonas sp. 24(2023)]WMJ68807.1 hypothetical protein Q9R17_16720 [Stenotrophomonas sp. 24(2023)]
MLQHLLRASVLGLLIAAGTLVPSVPAQASPQGVVTECEQIRVGRAWHQRCTVYDVAADGTREMISVYYIDEFGMPYVI